MMKLKNFPTQPAKALYGDLDTSAGRSMRRRSDPKPVEEKKKATPKRTSKV